MHKFIVKSILALCVAVTPAFAAETPDAEQARYLEESRKTAQEFMQTLGGTLKKQLEVGGVESAIAVCKQVAPALAEQYSKDGMQVKRVSLKARNKTLGTPDDWENKVLQGFNHAQAEGKPASDMEVAVLTKNADGQSFRYMKAIPTQALCLQCHGKPADIPVGVKALLQKEYPEDKAVGYSVGEIRGAISIQRELSVLAE